jgi:hypothetical protein
VDKRGNAKSATSRSKPRLQRRQQLTPRGTLGGQAISAQYLRSAAQLESVGDGRYFVRLCRDPMKPVYAYQTTGAERMFGAPQKFVLDLRGRAPVPVPQTDRTPGP